MALRAGYYGLKRFVRNKLSILAASIPADISPDNPIAVKNDVITSIDLLDDTVGWIVKNFFNNKQSVADKTTTTNRTITDTGVRVTNSEATAYGYVRFNLSLSVNTDYTISSKITRNAGVCHILVKGSADDVTYTTLLEKTYNTGDIEDTFNTGNNTYIRLYLYCSIAESVVGDITYDELMISKADAYKLSNIFAPYHASVAEVLDTKMPLGRLITSADDLDTIFDIGVHRITTPPAHSPEGSGYCTLEVLPASTASFIHRIQKANIVYSRFYNVTNQAWENWNKFIGTEIIPPSPTPENETKKATKKKVINEEEE